MGYKSKFKGAEIDAILESCAFPTFFYDAFIQEAVTKDVIDNMWQYLRERNVLTIHDIRLGAKLTMNAANEVIVTSDLTIVNDKLYRETYIFFYDGDGIVHNEYFEEEYLLVIPQ